MARSPDREMVIQLRTELQACQSRARLALLGAIEIETSLTKRGMCALNETNPALQAARRLVRLLRGEEASR